MTSTQPPSRRDADFERLLDEALAPPQPPADLSQHIVKATRHHLPRRPVLALIGWPGVAAAAALAACVTLWVTLGPTASDPSPQTPHTAAMDWESELAAVTQTAFDSEIDREIAMLRWDIDFALTEESALMNWSDAALLWQWESDSADALF